MFAMLEKHSDLLETVQTLLLNIILNLIQEIMADLILLIHTAVLVQDKQVCTYLCTSLSEILVCAIQKVLNLTESYLKWDYVWCMIDHSKKM